MSDMAGKAVRRWRELTLRREVPSAATAP